MESRENSEPHAEDREQGTPQGQLTNEEPESGESQEGGFGAPEEGGADSAADAAGEGG
jgi:hypothetical protein